MKIYPDPGIEAAGPGLKEKEVLRLSTCTVTAGTEGMSWNIKHEILHGVVVRAKLFLVLL